jgi:protein N-terminal methyltransferase
MKRPSGKREVRRSKSTISPGNFPRMTEAEIADPKTVFDNYKAGWYDASVSYWSKQEPTVDGMLGGYPELARFDIISSRDLVQKYQNVPKFRRKAVLGNECVADCGCGIGRVAASVLSDHFHEIDLIDPVERFADIAVQALGTAAVRVRKIIAGVQNWIPDRCYDAFWIQWVILYLTDDDAVSFLSRCRQNLKINGLIFIKDNLASNDLKGKREEAQFFQEDRSVCRAYSHYLALFKRAKLKLVEVEKQDHWPEAILPLYTFVVQ